MRAIYEEGAIGEKSQIDCQMREKRHVAYSRCVPSTQKGRSAPNYILCYLKDCVRQFCGGNSPPDVNQEAHVLVCEK